MVYESPRAEHETPEYSCRLVPHPQGKWKIGGIRYRPEWPRMPFPGSDELIAEGIVRKAIKEAKKYASQNSSLSIKANRYVDGRLQIIIGELKHNG